MEEFKLMKELRSIDKEFLPNFVEKELSTKINPRANRLDIF